MIWLYLAKEVYFKQEILSGQGLFSYPQYQLLVTSDICHQNEPYKKT